MKNGSTTHMPAIFFGHGTPMNALADNVYTRAWQRMGRQVVAQFGKPRAIVVISAHWYTRGTYVTQSLKPPTIHDFGAFSDALFQIQYPAPGHPELAQRIVRLLEPSQTYVTDQWGLDHGAWSVLLKAFPDADIPVVQLSMDGMATPRMHFELGRRLSELRDENVLIVGSGNVVHNLSAVVRRPGVTPFDWAQRFHDHVRSSIESGQPDALIDHASFGRDARMSIPTPDHYLPLLYVLGARDEIDDVSFDTSWIEFGSLSMMSVAFGMKLDETPTPAADADSIGNSA
jgi:4,5-DOPA dioxygenase extradiol